MNWRQELQKLEGAYATVISEKSPVGASSKLTSSLRISNTQQVATGFNYKKWTDQGIRQFPPRSQIRILERINIEFFAKSIPVVSLARATASFTAAVRRASSSRSSIFKVTVKKQKASDLLRPLLDNFKPNKIQLKKTSG